MRAAFLASLWLRGMLKKKKKKLTGKRSKTSLSNKISEDGDTVHRDLTVLASPE